MLALVLLQQYAHPNMALTHVCDVLVIVFFQRLMHWYSWLYCNGTVHKLFGRLYLRIAR
jgi:hypothetical protein